MDHKPEDIKSAHDKQKRKYCGEGGITFTKAEQTVLDEHVPLSFDDEDE